MKFQLAVFVCIAIALGSISFGQETPDAGSELKPYIEDSRQKATISLEQLVTELASCDVVFLGEQHDNDSGHEFQLNVIQALVDQGHQVAISTEQFERDVQGALDDYLAGRIDEESFLKAARPWKNYEQHYRPIIELAKQHKLPVLAANIPRRIASIVSEGNEVTESDRSYLPRYSNTPKNEYWQKFQATMKGHVGADGDDKLQKFYASQCLKDDSMAETITDFMAKNLHQRKIVIHLCGHFHSDGGLGTAARVIQRCPLARTIVVTMELQKPDGEKADLDAVRARGHYTFWIVKNNKPETQND